MASVRGKEWTGTDRSTSVVTGRASGRGGGAGSLRWKGQVVWKWGAVGGGKGRQQAVTGWRQEPKSSAGSSHACCRDTVSLHSCFRTAVD